MSKNIAEYWFELAEGLEKSGKLDYTDYATLLKEAAERASSEGSRWSAVRAVEYRQRADESGLNGRDQSGLWR